MSFSIAKTTVETKTSIKTILNEGRLIGLKKIEKYKTRKLESTPNDSFNFFGSFQTIFILIAFNSLLHIYIFV